MIQTLNIRRYGILSISIITQTIIAHSFAQDRELHGIGIYEGIETTNGVPHGPTALVYLNRPNKDVTLTLGSYDAVRWKIDISPKTNIERIVLHGYKADRSEIWINGRLFEGDKLIVKNLRHYRSTDGKPFRDALRTIPDALGFEKFSSIQAIYRPEPEGFIIDKVDKNNPNLDKKRLLKASLPLNKFRSIFDLTSSMDTEHQKIAMRMICRCAILCTRKTHTPSLPVRDFHYFLLTVRILNTL